MDGSGFGLAAGGQPGLADLAGRLDRHRYPRNGLLAGPHHQDDVPGGLDTATVPYMLADTELLQLTRKSEHNELVRKFVAAGLFPAG